MKVLYSEDISPWLSPQWTHFQSRLDLTCQANVEILGGVEILRITQLWWEA
jgi:hypothetical protein